MTPPRPNLFLRFLAWVGGHELAVLAAIAGVAGGIWLFAGIADEMREGDTTAFDTRILLSMRHAGDLAPLGPPWVQESARDVTALGGVLVLSLITVTTVGFLVLDGKGRMALFVFTSVVSGVAASTVLKFFFHRPRPDIVPHADYVVSTSFPSGHSMMSAVTYLTLGALLARSHERKRLKAYFLSLAGLLTCFIGISRVYLGVHWPTDVLAGWTAGAVWALLCGLVARWLQSRNKIEKEGEHAAVAGS